MVCDLPVPKKDTTFIRENIIYTKRLEYPAFLVVGVVRLELTRPEATRF